MYSSITIANYFLRKAWNEEIDLTPMHVLKLVYIAHGWCLGEKDEPLIRDRIRAWPYGPVIPELYHYVKGYGRGPVITLIISAFPTVNEEVVDESVASFLDTIWEHYKGFEAFELSGLTHQKGSPWDQTVSNRPRKGLSTHAIPILNSTIKNYYKNRIRAAAVDEGR
ncbi:MAG: DUF4065 domain-containing protein [Bacteroidetes bacterium]|nr:DUF4065 domain-containing protein [Bacteroidota bacterium]